MSRRADAVPSTASLQRFSANSYTPFIAAVKLRWPLADGQARWGGWNGTETQSAVFPRFLTFFNIHQRTYNGYRLIK